MGVLVGVGTFGIVRVITEMAEALGILTPRWGEGNIATLLLISGIAAAPAALWFVFWFYRKAHNAELHLQNYKYVPVKNPTPSKV